MQACPGRIIRRSDVVTRALASAGILVTKEAVSLLRSDSRPKLVNGATLVPRQLVNPLTWDVTVANRI